MNKIKSPLTDHEVALRNAWIHKHQNSVWSVIPLAAMGFAVPFFLMQDRIQANPFDYTLSFLIIGVFIIVISVFYYRKVTCEKYDYDKIVFDATYLNDTLLKIDNIDNFGKSKILMFEVNGSRRLVMRGYDFADLQVHKNAYRALKHKDHVRLSTSRSGLICYSFVKIDSGYNDPTPFKT